MLVEFTELEARDPRRMERVTQVIGHLLRHQFLHVEDRGSPPMLETLLRADSERLVAAYFDVAGYRLVVRGSEGWAGILPDPERISLPRMRIDETLVLLLLRRLWEEAVQEGDLQRHGSVLLTLNEAFAAYQEVVARARRPAMNVQDFREAVRSLERRALVRLGEYDPDAQDQELTVRAVLSTVAGDDFLASLELLLRADPVTDAPVPDAGG